MVSSGGSGGASCKGAALDRSAVAAPVPRIATCRSSAASTSRSKPVPAWCTPRRRTAWTTTSSARNTTCRWTTRSATTASSSARRRRWRSANWPARSSGKPIRLVLQELERQRSTAQKRENPAQLPALLAAQDADHLPRHARSGSSAWKHTQGEARRPCAGSPSAPSTNTEFFPAWGRARLEAMIKNRPDWCVSRQRNWGVPMPFFVHKETGAAASAHRRSCWSRSRSAWNRQGIEAWFSLDAAELLGAEAEHYSKVSDTLDVWFDSGITHCLRAARLARRRTGLPGRSVPRRLRPASRLVPVLAAHRLRHRRPRAVQGAAHARLRGGRQGPQDAQVQGQRHRAAEGVRQAGRRHPAPVGGVHRLLRRADHFRRNPQARRRRLSPHPQHAALPAGQYVRFRRRHSICCRSRSGWRSTAMRWR